MPLSDPSPPTTGPGVAAPSTPAPGLATLTGVRSGKKSYYVELRHNEERMTSAVRALEGISTALVRSRQDPRALLGEVLAAAARHLDADWTLLALHRGEFADLTVRALVVGPGGSAVDDPARWPEWVRAEVTDAAAGSPTVAHGAAGPAIRTPMELDGRPVGRLVTRLPGGRGVDHADRWVLTILANQAAMSMHTATLYRTADDLGARAQELYDQVGSSSRDLQARTEELQQAEQALRRLHEREVIDGERHRIALELHDSVAQHVLSAGLAVELCRAEAADEPDRSTRNRFRVHRLTEARDAIARAGEELRSVIYALHHEPADGEPGGLPGLLERLASQHRAALEVTVRIEGRPVPLPAEVERGLARSAGEALFNVSIHARAARAVVHLRYRPGTVVLVVGDDGDGDPAELRRRLRVALRGDSDGRHQGMASMARRAQDLGGSFTVRRSRLGGVEVTVRAPIPRPDQGSPSPEGVRP